MRLLGKPVVVAIIIIFAVMANAMAADLIVNSITWQPATDLQDGQSVTFTAQIQNTDSDTVATDFTVGFWVDGENVGETTAPMMEVPLGAGGTTTVAFEAQLHAGDSVVTVSADSGNTIIETNETNNSLSADLPVIIDTTPPEDIVELYVSDSHKNSLTFSWGHSPNSMGDLAGYKVFFNGAAEAQLLPATQSSFQQTGLAAASAYDIRIIAYDNSGNESEGVSVTGYTALENPAGLIASSRPAFVDLSWEPSTPEDNIAHYAVYVSETDFLSIDGLSAYNTTSDTSMTIGGLEGGRLYYFAVVAVNLSGGMDESVATVSGSPEEATLVSGTIRADTTWTLDKSPYVVTGDISIFGSYSDKATLTIEPGVEVLFSSGTILFIGYPGSHVGALVAQGTADLPITFTSAAETPAPGDWEGIYFRVTTDEATTIMEHCIVEYGGQSYDANIYCSSASPTIKSSTIRYSSASGIYLYGRSNPVIGGEEAGNLITENTTYGINSAGSYPSPTITQNTFSNNGSSALRLRPYLENVSQNTGSGNGTDAIELFGEQVRMDTTWQTNNLPYMVTGDISIFGSYSDKATLTIEPGVEVLFSSGTILFIGYPGSHVGALVAQGTADLPITFTSAAETPAPGDWEGIYFRVTTDEATTIMEHCIVEYGGQSYDANIYCSSASPTIKSSTIRYSSASGIYLYGSSSPVIGGEDAGNTITDNTTYGISSGGSSPSPTITHNDFSGNGSSAMRLRPYLVNVSQNTGSGNGTDGIELFGEQVRSDTNWQTNSLPYVVTGDISILGNYSDKATLTIEPGVEIRFITGTCLFIGYPSSHIGALVAQGTSDLPITFTSAAETPAPGDWEGIYFRTTTDDTSTIMEHCIVEYGGQSYNANIYLYTAAPTFQHNTIRNSSHSGIYAYGNGNDGAVISCNNLKDNVYGIYTAQNAQPVISGNNFLGSRNYGVYNVHAEEVTANGNWWGDANGPNINGDATYGAVTVDTWLMTESECITAPPTNSPPLTPRNPTPADNAVRIPVLQEEQPVAVSLTWAGGDPNPWDTVVYDLYFGQSAGALSLTAESLGDTGYEVSGLDGGTMYYWQVVARDDAGAETTGPVWKFTTLGYPPDLEISQAGWEPVSDLIAGQTLTLSAAIVNSGSGPVVDSFRVAFTIDGATVATRTVDPIVAVNETRQVTAAWTATKGIHQFGVIADSGGSVDESYEENNSFSATMPEVVDTTPPELGVHSPTAGSAFQELSTLSFTLADAHGTIDDAAVIASVVLINGSGQAVAGTTTEAADTFTFTPAALPLDDGTYTLSFNAVDDSGNTARFTITFTVDGQLPSAPTLTGGEILSGTLAARPAQNRANTASVVVTGTREDDTALYINDMLKAALGSGNWSVTVNLEEGDNTLEIWLQDAAANRSASVFADIAVDSVAPAITTIVPAADSFLNASPAAITIAYSETGSGLNAETCTIALQDGNSAAVSGNPNFSTSGTIIFTPASALADDAYTLNVQLEDNFTNQSSVVTRQFTVDTQAPAAPVIDPVESPTHNPNQTVSGTKEAFAAIFLNGAEAVEHTEATTWQYTTSLVSGENTLAFTAVDRADNTSEAATVSIVFDDIAPDPVTTLTVDGQGSGTSASLSWAGYNEAAHGDVAVYRVYWLEGAAFSNVSSMSIGKTEPAGTFSTSITGLTKGATVWFAVVAVDAMGNVNPSVTPVSAALTDVQAPEDVTGLAVESLETGLTFSWNASANSTGDLAGYRIYVNGATDFVALGTDRLTYELTGLAAASGHSIRVTAVDDMPTPNESRGASITGATWLSNPTGLAAEPFSGYVRLEWSATQPASLVKNYRIYVKDASFTDVSGMTPAVTSAGTSAKVSGLTNGTTYWFGVTTVNTSDGERPSVATVSATPMDDVEGPEISSLLAGGVAFVDGFELASALTLSLNADDPAGVSRIQFFLDGALIRTDYSAPFTCYLDPSDMDDGPHQLTITAYDTLDNSRTITISFTVALSLPAAPTITSPADGTTTNESRVVVSGKADLNTEVRLYKNDSYAGASANVDGQGYFSIVLALSEGENRLQATAANRAGESPKSAQVLVTLDTTLPSAPTGVMAEAKEGGVIRVSWQKPSDTTAAGYNLYRGSTEFSAVSQAEKVNPTPITGNRYSDVLPFDETWYYRVTTIDNADNESEPSNQVSAISDSTPPRAASIVYTPGGQSDPDTGAMAPGHVDLSLTVTEELQATPFLSITPSGGIPIAVDLTKIDDTTYAGAFTISDTTPSGTAWAVFSARDSVGNRGTEIDSGASILLDTKGPSVVRLTVTPASPIKNSEEEPVTVTAVIGLSEAVKTGTLPDLAYLLSGADREEMAVDSLIQTDPRSGEAQAWQATFSLPADAGLSESESLSLVYSAADNLDNIGTDIEPTNRFQVYQGDLPPLAAPDGLTARALPGGKVMLTWNPVEEAIAYRLYRQAPADDELSAFIRVDEGTQYEDATEEDGYYTYAVTSIRSENGEESESGLSETVTVYADSEAPGMPTNFSLELAANGIEAAWTAPAYTEPITYRLYRSSSTEITDVTDLTPIIENIEQTNVVDPNPSPDDHCYTVTAMDEAGNESLPAASSYLNFGLLPVSSLEVEQSGDNSPVISWTHAGSTIAGYNIYLGSVTDGIKLNTDLITGLSHTDIGWAEDTRRYTVTAVDSEDVESLGRAIVLPKIEATLPEDAIVRRGLMNKLSYTVANGSENDVANARIMVELNGLTHTSETFGLAGGEQAAVGVVVGGYEDLIDPMEIATTVEITPDTNEKVRIVRQGYVDVGEGMLTLQIFNEEFVRGGTGKVWFTLENTGDEEIEIITALNAGNSDSNGVVFTLLDEDENTIAVKSFRQAVGDGVVTLSDTSTVARIDAGDVFTSQAIEIDVPATAPDAITVLLSITDVYHHKGRDTEVRMKGLATTHAVTLVETSYTGIVDTIEPRSSDGDEDVVISGRAVERATGDPLGGVPLKLVISHDGFERTFEVYTGDDGFFSYSYTPESGESGIFQVRAVHPDLTDRPVHGEFTINRIAISPSTGSLNIPRNYEKTITVAVTAGEGTDVTDLQFVFDPEDQAGGVLPEGIHLTTGNPVSSLAGGDSAELSCTIWADNNASDTETMVLRVTSAENDHWCDLTINAAFSDAQPVLQFSPDHIETGMANGDTVTETITLSNKGVVAMTGVSLTLLSSDGSAAPAWIVLNGEGDIGDLDVGDTHEASITFAPGENASEGIYHLILRVTSDNYAQTDINLYASVTQSGIGNVLYKIADIYTGTLDTNLQVIQGLEGATITLQNELVTTQTFTATSDSAGEALFEDLPSGRYKARITAANHQEYIGRLWIKPGITATEDIFLEYNLVTVEWSVSETTIEDEYEIVLSATYETNVPAPVVVIEPTSFSLPAMQAGDVLNGEITMTNYGLVQANALMFNLPENDSHFEYEFYGTRPEILGAMQRVVIPYRVTCLSPLEPDADGTGGGCGSYVSCMTVDYTYCCAVGHCTTASVQHCWSRGWGSDCGGSGSGWWGTGSSGGGHAGSSGSSSGSASIGGTDCPPCWDDPDCPKKKEAPDASAQSVGCEVDTSRRQFTDEEVDLTVKVLGGHVSVTRFFNGDEWNNTKDQHGVEVRSGGLYYRLPRGGTRGCPPLKKASGVARAHNLPPIYLTRDFKKITKIDDNTYKIEKLNGEWATSDKKGNILSFGTRQGMVGKMIYDIVDDTAMLRGVTDRNGHQVIWYEYNDDDKISAARDAQNRRVEYYYDGKGLLSRVVDLNGNETTYEYNDEGQIVRKVDGADRETLVTYNGRGDVSSVKDSQGNGQEFEFDSDRQKHEYYARTRFTSGRVKEVWFDSTGETKTVAINGEVVQDVVTDSSSTSSSARETYIKNEKGQTTYQKYDENSNLTQVTFADGSTVSFEYDLTFNKITKMTDPLGVVTEYTYDDNANLLTRVEAVGTESERTTTYTYDSANQLFTSTIHGETGEEDITTSFTYDANGNLETITDPEGGVTRFTQYDNAGNPERMIDPRGNPWLFEYDALGHMISQTDPLNNTTSYEYDGAYNRTAVINAHLKRFEFEFDDHNNMIRAIDPAGRYVQTDYNTDNLPVRMTDKAGKSNTLTHDTKGRLIKRIDGAGNEIVYNYDEDQDSRVSSYWPVQIDYPTFSRRLEYDRLGRVIRELDDLGSETHSRKYTYDDAGNVLTVTDEENNTTRFEYDVFNRLVKTTDALGGEVINTYDLMGNLVQVQDTNKGNTFFHYDKNSRLIKIVRPMLEETTYEYDGNGNRTAVIDSKGQRIEYEYNAIDRLEKVLYFEAGNWDTPVKSVDFDYDDLGNLTSYDDGTTSAVYEYDDLQQKTSETVNYGAFSLNCTYAYTDNGLKKTFTGPDGAAIEYAYDENNRLVGIAVPGQGQVNYQYDTAHWNSPAGRTLPGGGGTEYDYDPLMRLAAMTSMDPGRNTLMSREYEYSPAGNITDKLTEHGDYAYNYDELHRLVGALNPTLPDEDYTYDAMGNRIASSATSGDWEYNADNQLMNYDTTTFAYDANGNMTRKTVDGVTRYFVYDIEDRMIRVEDGDHVAIAEYYYDPFGRRLWKDVSGTRTNFLYSDEGLIGEYDATGNEIKTYGWLPDSVWGTNPLFLKQDGSYYWYHNDSAGTPQRMVRANGSTVWAATYDSFGNAQVSIEQITNPFRFSGQYFDAETGLHYNLNRYYDPAIGRYLRLDPLGDGLNLYAYCFNDPINWIDPEGLCSVGSGFNYFGFNPLDWITPSSAEAAEFPPVDRKYTYAQMGDDVGRDLIFWDGETPYGGGGLGGGGGRFGGYAPKRTHMHHQTPREVLKKHLPPDVANNPNVRGKPGMPNRRKIEVDEHKRIHKGKGGGQANELTKQKIEDLGREPTVDDVLRIRKEVNNELGIKYVD